MVLFIELNVVEKYSDVQAFWVFWGKTCSVEPRLEREQGPASSRIDVREKGCLVSRSWRHGFWGASGHAMLPNSA